MPKRPLKPCSYSGCVELVSVGTGYCDKHKQQKQKQYDKQRGTAAQRGYDSRWREARDQYLKDNPLCVDCLEVDKITPATVVDHNEPHKGDPVKFWDKSNWKSRCKRHHDIKTATLDGGFGNKIKG